MTVRLRGLQRMSLASAATWRPAVRDQLSPVPPHASQRESGTPLVATVASPERAPSLGLPRRSEQSGPRPLIPSRLGFHAPRLAATLLLFTTAAALALTATPAQARQARIFSGSFGGADTTVKDPYPLGHPWSVAVDQATGDVYASDPDNHRVEKFSASGEFILMFGKEVNRTKVEGFGTEAEQDVCTEVEVESGAECKEGVAGSAPGAFLESVAMYVAVDSSSGPSAGDVYVGQLDEHVLANNRVQKFDGSGHLVSGWGEGGQLNGSGVLSPPAPLPGPFNALLGIAVDPSGNLWVSGKPGAATERVFEFPQDAEGLVTDWAAEAGIGMAVDSEDNVYVSAGTPVLKYDSAGTEIGQVTGPGVGSDALAVDPATNDLYVGSGSEQQFNVLRYGPSCVIGGQGAGCEPVETFSSDHLGFSRGLALDPAVAGDPLYAAEVNRGEVAGFSVETVPDVSTVRASGFASGTALLNGAVNPDGVELNAGTEGCEFEWGETTAPYEHVVSCAQSAAQIGSGSAPVAVSAEVAGLVQGHTYHFRLVAGNHNDINAGLEVDEPSVGQDLSFGPPLLHSESVSGVSATAATLEAEVAPNNVDTHVQIQYGTDTSYGLVAPGVDIGSGESDRGVLSHVQGLAPGTVYHYRVVATSVLGVVEGEDRMFRTQDAGAGAGGVVLPDARDWELVSPADKHGASIEPIFTEVNFAIQAAAVGDAFSYVTTTAVEAGAEGNSNLSQVLSTRTGPGAGWRSRDIAIPHDEAAGITFSFQEYRLFSEDLSLGLLAPIGAFNPALSPEGSAQTPYLRSDFPAGAPGALCAGSCYRPLVTATEGFADVPEGTEFGVDQFHGGQTCPPQPQCGPKFLGGTPDFAHVVLRSLVALEEGAPAESLYEWSAGQLGLVSILPDGQPDASGSRPLLGLGQTARQESLDTRNAISTDGMRIVWEDHQGGNLYLRDVASGETVRLGGGAFQDASSDGSRVLFSQGGQLEQCQLVEEPGNLHCDLTDLGALTGTVIGASPDASFVYFVSAGNELVVSHDGVLSPITALSGDDFPDWAGGQGGGTEGALEPLQRLTARVSPDGRSVAFMSDGSLTGYDNHDALSARPDEEVFLYRAGAGEGEQGSLVCASCNPTGGRPHGVEFSQLETGGGRLGLAGGGTNVWPRSQWLAANIPTWTNEFHQSRYLSDGGRLFFNSSDALVPQDTNNTEDVYQYEPPAGEGTPPSDGCASGSPTFSAASGGCVGLISSGSSPQESAFLDASETGQDSFFLTTAKLSASDHDSAIDVYDAHACTTGSPCPPPPPTPQPACEGDACQTTVQPPADVTPGSLTFQGPGNLTAPLSIKPPVKPKPLTNAQKLTKALKACRHKHRHKRAACEHAARKTFAAKKAGRTGGPRGRAR